MQATRLPQEFFSKRFIQRSFESEQIRLAAEGACWIIRAANKPGLSLVSEMMPIRFRRRIPLFALVLCGAGGIDDRRIKDRVFPWPLADFVYNITPFFLSL